MDQISPYLLCTGIFCVWPMLLFGMGYYLGRNGSPVAVQWRGVKGRGDPDNY